MITSNEINAQRLLEQAGFEIQEVKEHLQRIDVFFFSVVYNYKNLSIHCIIGTQENMNYGSVTNRAWLKTTMYEAHKIETILKIPIFSRSNRGMKWDINNLKTKIKQIVEKIVEHNAFIEFIKQNDESRFWIELA